jgi:hypothetical protein
VATTPDPDALAALDEYLAEFGVGRDEPGKPRHMMSGICLVP